MFAPNKLKILTIYPMHEFSTLEINPISKERGYRKIGKKGALSVS
jgi:hypothetical protein